MPLTLYTQVAISFALGHTLNGGKLDADPDRVAADIDGIVEKFFVGGHARSSARLESLVGALVHAPHDPETRAPLTEPHRSLALLLGLAQAPTGTGSHFEIFAARARPGQGDKLALPEAADTAGLSSEEVRSCRVIDEQGISPVV